MVTKSSGIFKPKECTTDANIEVLETFEQEINNNNWKRAMNEEYSALMRNKTWSVVSPSKDKNIIGCKWTYKIKRNSNGTIQKYKARLVAKGYTQRHGFDFKETFSPVVKPTTIRVILIISLHEGWNIRQLDVNNTFVNGER